MTSTSCCSGDEAGGALGFQLAFQGGGALVYHGFEFVVRYVGEGEIEDVVGDGGDGGEEAVEENRMEDACFFVSTEDAS